MVVFKLRQAIFQALKKIGLDSLVLPKEIFFEHPQEETHGDYATNIALVMFSNIKRRKFKTPQELAEKIVASLPKADFLEKVEAAPPGFINFWLSKEYLFGQLKKVLKEKSDFGQTALLKGKKIMVEFAHPNTLKPFHIGHLRNICLGEALARILEKNGAQVVRTNYQGDVGLHIAKTLWGVGKLKTKNKKLKTLEEKIEFLGRAYVEGAKAYEEDQKAKKEIIKINEKIYQKDPQILPLWQKTRGWSLEYFDKIYKRLDTRFDRLYFESECVEGKEIAKKLVKKGILEESKGAIIFNGKKYGLDTRVFVNQLGFPTYEAKELKLAELEFSEFGRLDQCIHVVGPEQTSFFKVTFKVQELLDPKKYKGKQYHLVYGWVRLKTGKMSSRKGEVVLACWLLDKVKERLLSQFKMDREVAEKVAVSAVKYSFLKFAPKSEIVFDISESINLEGDSGPYLQYTYARCKSVLRKAGLTLPDRSLKPIPDRKRFAIGVNEEEETLLRTLYKFAEVVGEAGENYAPNLICNFLFDLAQKFNAFYNKHSILQPISKTTSEVEGSRAKARGDTLEVEKTKNFRLALTAATAQVLKTGLDLLGIKTLERM